MFDEYVRPLVKYTPHIRVTAVFAQIEYVGEVYTTCLYEISRPLEQPHCHYLIATLIITLLG